VRTVSRYPPPDTARGGEVDAIPGAADDVPRDSVTDEPGRVATTNKGGMRC